MKRKPTFAVLLAAMTTTLTPAVFAHDIPNDVTVRAFVKPSGQRLNLLIRVPLQAMRDIDFPSRGAGYLDLAKTRHLLPEAASLWLSDAIDIYENGARLPKPRIVKTRVSLESDKSFASYDQALAHATGAEIPDNTDVYWNQTLLDVLFEYPIHSDQSGFSIHPALDRLGVRVLTVLRFLPPSGVIRAFEYEGDPGLVRLDPRWSQAALRFIKLGFLHILDGTDHLLFLLCLVIPFRRFGALVPVVTAFTVAHSITLIASAYNLAPDALWFPPLIETLIAISIFYMALENIVGGSTLRRRWVTAFGFGLVHGFGFLCTARYHGVRRVPSADIAAFLQSRRRAGSASGAAAADSRTRCAFPLRGGRTDGDHHPLRAGGPHRLALDDRSRGPPAAISLPMAGDHCRIASLRHTLADVDRSRRRPDLAIRILRHRQATAASGSRTDRRVSAARSPN